MLILINSLLITHLTCNEKKVPNVVGKQNHQLFKLSYLPTISVTLLRVGLKSWIII